jgi:hypothetical protein
MIDIRSDKEFDLYFHVDIRGSNETPKSRFVIETNNNINVSFDGSFDPATDKVRVSFPKLEVLDRLLESEIFKAKLEVIVENSYFTPWSDKVRVKTPIVVSAESVEYETTTIEESTAEVSDSPQIVYKEDKLENLKNVLPTDRKQFVETVNEKGITVRKFIT